MDSLVEAESKIMCCTRRGEQELCRMAGACSQKNGLWRDLWQVIKEYKVGFAAEPFCRFAIFDEGTFLMGNILGAQKSKQTGDNWVRAFPCTPDLSHLLTATKPNQVLSGAGFPPPSWKRCCASVSLPPSPSPSG